MEKTTKNLQVGDIVDHFDSKYDSWAAELIGKEHPKFVLSIIFDKFTLSNFLNRGCTLYLRGDTRTVEYKCKSSKVWKVLKCKTQ